MKKVLLILISALMLMSALVPTAAAEEPEVFVFDEFKDYMKQTTYLANDGVIGIPVEIVTYCKNPNTDSETNVIMYVMGANIERIGTEKNVDIIADLLDEGYIVVTLDYLGAPEAKGTALDFSVQTIKKNMNTYTKGLNRLANCIYVLPEGYRILSEVVFYTIDENGTKGCLERLVKSWTNGFKESKGASKVPGGWKEAKTIEDCIDQKGNTVDLRYRLSIIYPSQPTRETPVWVNSSSNTHMIAPTVTTYSPAMANSAVFGGCTFVVYDHCYIPMASRIYGYYGDYSLMSWISASCQAAAMRCARYYSKQLGYSSEDYVAYGISKASWVSTLASPNPELVPEKSVLTEFGYVREERYGEQPYLIYDDGTRIPAGVNAVYAAMGDGVRDTSLKRFVDENIAPTYTACGIQDQYGCWNWWPDVQKTYAESGAEHIALSSYDRGHEFPYEIDTVYKHDRYATFVDFLMYHAKKDIPVSIFYTSAVDGKLVEAGPTGEILESDDIIIQFVAAVNEGDLKVELVDETAKKSVAFGLEPACGGTRWQVVPNGGLTKGNKYTLRVLGETKGKLNGIEMGEDKEYSFTY